MTTIGPLPWLAPYRDTPLNANVLVPSSKSLTNRAFVLAALAEQPSTVIRALSSRDSTLMSGALEALGTELSREGVNWHVTPGSLANTPATVDCGLAGTVMRFVPILAGFGTAPIVFDGDERARVRPMAATISALRALGIDVDDDGRDALPFTVRGNGGIVGGELSVDASSSSQFVSSILLAAPRFERGIDLRHKGSTVPSLPHIDMTIAELRRRGVDVDDSEPDRWIVKPGPIQGIDVEIEPDLSNSGVFIGAALATGGSVRVRNWPEETTQAGDAWRELVTEFGGYSQRHGMDMEFGIDGPLQGVDLDLHAVGELTPVIAALAALAEGTSHLRGIAHLRGHETDRLAALAREINRLGGAVEETPDGLIITPKPMHGEIFRTYDDHRMAHAAVILALRVPEIFVEDVSTTVKTYPNFAPVWERLVS